MLAAGQEDSADIVEALVEAKADPNIRDKVCLVLICILPLCIIIYFLGTW